MTISTAPQLLKKNYSLRRTENKHEKMKHTGLYYLYKEKNEMYE